MSPSPNRYHQAICRNLGVMLYSHVEQHSLGEVYFSPFDVTLGEHNVFQPDLVSIANHRLSILTDAGASGGPTLVIEVLSPSTADQDRTVKRRSMPARESRRCGSLIRI